MASGCDLSGHLRDFRPGPERRVGVLGGVRTYADLEPSFLGRVEELIDFVAG